MASKDVDDKSPIVATNGLMSPVEGAGADAVVGAGVEGVVVCASLGFSLFVAGDSRTAAVAAAGGYSLASILYSPGRAVGLIRKRDTQAEVRRVIH